LAEACQPVLTMLQKGGAAADEDTLELLCATLPSAVKAVAGSTERHRYQESLLDAVAAQLAGIGESRQANLNGAEKEKSDLETEIAQAEDTKAAMAARVAEKQKAVDEFEKVRKEKEKLLAEANAVMEAAVQKAAAGDSEKLAMEKDHADFVQGLTDLWAPLKNSEITQWRARDKFLQRLADKLKVVGVPEALMQALPVALKIKVDTRSEFGKLTVAHGEELYSKHVDALKEKLDNFGQELQSRAEAVAAAEASAKAAQEALDTAMQTSIDAQNAWAEEQTGEHEHSQKMKGHGPAVKACDAKLDEAKTALGALQEVVSKFEAVRPVEGALKTMAGPVEEAPAAAEAAAPADVPMESTEAVA